MSDIPTLSDRTTTPQASVSAATAFSRQSAGVTQTAINLAIQLDQLRAVYGEDCFAYVVRALRESGDVNAEQVIYAAARQWLQTHPRVVLDLDYVS